MAEMGTKPENMARWLLRTAILFTLMAAPYVAFDLSVAIFVAIGIVGVYALWRIVALYRKSRGAPVHPHKVRLLVAAYATAVPLILIGLIVATLLAWPLWAYDSAVITSQLRDSGLAAVVVVTACLVLLPLLFLIAAPLLAQNGGGDASRLLAGVRHQGLGRFHRAWLAHTAWAFGVIAALSPTLMADELLEIELLHDGDGIVSIWDLAAAFPILPMSLAFAASMLSLARSVEASADEDDSVVRGYSDDLPEESRANPLSGRILGALAACGCAASISLLLYPAHLYFVAKGTGTGVANLAQAAQAVGGLFERRNSGDWSNAQLAAELNRLGSWTPDAPHAGLATLVADRPKAFDDTCTIQIAAGLAGPDGSRASTSPAPEDASSDLKFCIAVACAPPVAWRAPPALVLLSSHASRARYWRKEAYLDLFAEGRAATPGGYCNADGTLADTYQG